MELRKSGPRLRKKKKNYSFEFGKLYLQTVTLIGRNDGRTIWGTQTDCVLQPCRFSDTARLTKVRLQNDCNSG